MVGSPVSPTNAVLRFLINSTTDVFEPAFSFVNFSVISRYALRDGRTKTFKDILSFVIIPLLGFISIFAMWLEIEETALKFGLWWAMFGILYLGYKTKGFRYPAPQHNEHE